MLCTLTRFIFVPTVSIDEVGGTLQLAQLAAASLHGPERVELEAHPQIDRAQRAVTIDTTSEAGRTVALIFLGYVRREFGERAFTSEQVDPSEEYAGREIRT